MPKNIINFSLLLFLILGTIFLWLPKYRDLTVLRFKVSEKELELQYKDQYFSDLKSLSLKLKEYSPELAKIDSALPADPSIPDLLNFIQKASSESGLILENVSLVGISPRETGSKIQKISLNLSLSGSFTSFKTFLSALYESSRLIEVDNIAFSSPEAEKPFSFKLKIKAYSY